MSDTRKLYIKSYGCQMNVYDSIRMADTMAREGYVETSHPEQADFLILNTCHIREKAADKVYSELGRVRLMKLQAEMEGRRMLVAVAGCVAQAEGEEILRRAPMVDIVVGPQSLHRLPALAQRATNGEAVVETEFPPEEKFDHLAPPRAAATRERGVTAFVTVQEGCDKFCTFCVVPYTRGMETSRPVEKIIDEVARLADAGVRDVTLIGQNVNAYHGLDRKGQSRSLADLLARVSDISGILRMRYTTSHPRDMTDDLIEAHCGLPKLAPYLHLPVQSGSDRILAAMNRGHGRADYLSAIGRVRVARPDIAITSDFIVGFPGETEADFRATLELIEKIGFAMAYSFKYSPRPGTPASEMDQVSEGEMTERLQRIQALIDRQWHKFNSDAVGQSMSVLFDKRGKLSGQLAGKSPYQHQVQAAAPDSLIGEIADVRIVRAGTNSLFGELESTAPPRAAAALLHEAAGGA